MNSDEDRFATATAQFYSVYLASLLLSNNLNEAKYLWKRIPAIYKPSNQTEPPNTPTSVVGSLEREALSNVWAIGVAMWQNDTPAVMQLFSQVSWPPLLQSLMGSLRQSVVTKSLRNISMVYANLNVSLLQSLCGLPVDAFQNGKQRNLQCDCIFFALGFTKISYAYLLELKELAWQITEDGTIVVPHKTTQINTLTSDVTQLNLRKFKKILYHW